VSSKRSSTPDERRRSRDSFASSRLLELEVDEDLVRIVDALEDTLNLRLLARTRLVLV